ncbi:insecticyanin-A-like [Portunus trituberculatus]|uniref:insecticyanin-A-like n=1 Tax=Portunus trituberculatus TaxID=210409 RepID=UPI001E1CCC54|nr:insecticyanin-A-like [Portunus trituberculatus]
MVLFLLRQQALAVVVVVVVVMVVVVTTAPPPPQDTTGSPTPSFLMGSPCPDVTPSQDFDAPAFGGTWHKFGGLPNEQEITKNCTIYNYKYTGSGFDVTESGIDGAGQRVNQTNSFQQVTPGIADFVTRVEGLEAHLQVLKTDYTSMACLYTCHTVRETHRVHLAWILSRGKDLDRKKIAECQVLLKNAKVPLIQLEKISHGEECL